MEQVFYAPDFNNVLPVLSISVDGQFLLMVDARMLHRALNIGLGFWYWIETCKKRRSLTKGEYKHVAGADYATGSARSRLLVTVEAAARIVLSENRPRSSEIRIYLLSQRNLKRAAMASTLEPFRTDEASRDKESLPAEPAK